MKKSTMVLILILAALVGALIAPGTTFALDAPHNLQDTRYLSVGCGACHTPRGSLPTWATAPTVSDNTKINNLCKSCHQPGKLSDAKHMDVKTHSSYQTSTTYGTWVVQCHTCHDQHYQNQADTYPSEGILSTGTVSSILVSAAVSTVTVQGLTAGSYANYVLVPNMLYPTIGYRVKDNTATTVTVWGKIDTSSGYAGPGKTFSVKYGKMIWNQITTPFDGKKTVKFFNPTSFVTATTPITGVCQVCHTKTHSYRNDGTLEDPVKHAQSSVGGNCMECHLHSEGFKKPLAGCADCHGNPPASDVEGPPGVVGFGPNNLTYGPTSATSPTSAGAHVKHATTLGMNCKVCHANTAMPTVEKKIQMQFQVNSTNYPAWGNTAATGGVFSGYSALTNTYTWEGGPGTTINLVNNYADANKCSNIYCHGSTLTGGANKTPSWVSGSSQAACGTCHGTTGATYTMGNHQRHAGTATGEMGLLCADCHGGAGAGGSGHVTGYVSWALNQANSLFGSSAQYSGAASGVTTTLAPSSAYASCSSVYCHSSAQSGTGGSPPASYATITWGTGALNCGSCHKNMSNDSAAPGSHPQHAQGASNYACSVCHSGYTANTVSTTIHVNRTVNTGFTGTAAGTFYTGGTTSGNHAAGGGYGACFTSACHGAGSPVWGNNFASDINVCTKCHGTPTAGVTVLDYLKAPPISTGTATLATDTKVGAHQVHLTTTAYRGPIACTECHKVPSAVGDAGHFDVTPNAEVTFLYSALANTYEGLSAPSATYDYATGRCSTTYCHDGAFFKSANVASRGTDTRPIWKDTAYLNTTPTSADCGKCHAYPPASPHPNDPNCLSCHPHVAAGNLSFNPSGAESIVKHIDGKVQGGGCNGCHEYPPYVGDGKPYMKVLGSAPTASQGKSQLAHKKHVDYFATSYTLTSALLSTSPAGRSYGDSVTLLLCGTCHSMGAGTHSTDGSGTRVITMNTASYQFVSTATLTYNGVPGQPTSSYPKTCSSVNCHFKATPVWQDPAVQ